MPARFYEFEVFRVDVTERQLWQNGRLVVLTAKAFDMLLVLLENRGRTVEKNELIRAVWADTHVEEGSLNRCISTLRKALGDDSSEQRLIKTLPKVGYRFTDRVVEITADAAPVPLVSVATSTENAPTRARSTARRKIFITLGVVFGFVLLLAWTISSKQDGGREIQGLTAHDLRQLQAAETPNSEAFDDYVKGRALWHNRSAEGLHQSILHLERAIRIDPDFALAHAALADAYAFDVQKRTLANAHAETAINLDPSLGQPYATIGFIQMFWDWDTEKANESFERAIELSPDYATAHQWYALNLIVRVRAGAALAEMKRAVELEPNSLAINADLCQMYYFLEKHDDAIAQCNKVLETDPNFLNAHAYLYDVYTAKSMYDLAVNELFTIESLKSDFVLPANEAQRLRTAYARGGIEEFWKTRIEWLAHKPQAYGLARYHARLGNTEQAIEWLGRARSQREFDFIFASTDPVFKPLANKPAFDALTDSLYATR